MPATANATKTVSPATDRQKELLDRLLVERVHQLSEESVALLKSKANRRDMSAVIDSLLRQPKKPTPRPAQPPVQSRVVTVQPGVYKKDGEIYEIKRSREGVYRVKQIRVVGKKVVRYGALVRPWQFTPADRITEDDASGFGKQYGICAICFRLLSDLESVRLGIGPVCRKKYFGR
ncbi:DUF6011 domain-containing protein [Microbispora bryophytorum]|uniref:DUF6011 domain-containing protein n=1 Tax=Microbispora bryophytorum TaxID=1460882 RepID=UPI0033CFF249